MHLTSTSINNTSCESQFEQPMICLSLMSPAFSLPKNYLSLIDVCRSSSFLLGLSVSL